MKISIKNMVCNRCISAVQAIFDKLEIEISDIDLGEVETKNEISTQVLQKLNSQLKSTGFEILEDSSKKQIEKIKNLIIQKLRRKTLQKILS